MNTGTFGTANRPQLYTSFGILLLRVFVGSRLLYGVLDNIISWEKMMEFSSFLDSFGFPLPLVSAVISVYLQFLAGLFILTGYKCRIFSVVMVINFAIALLFVHLPAKDTVEVMTPALAIFFICLALVFTGPGKISLKEKLSSKRK